MRLLSYTPLTALALLSIACPHGKTTPGGPAGPTLEQDAARLTIPPGAETADALQRLDARAERGDVAAGWARLHYLVDLFDDARFRRDDASLRALAAAQDRRPLDARGPAATDAALAGLLVEADRILAADRLHPGALAARTLIELDAEPPEQRDQLFQRMVELKTVAAGGGPLQHNARLRLFGFCREAFRDALRAPRHDRPRLLAFCLYPLYGSDPEPYFAADPARRPPPPRWRDLSAGMLALLAPIADSDSRLEPAANALDEQWQELIEDHAGDLPAPPTPAALGVPTVARAAPYDGAPLLAIGDGHAIASRDALVEQMRAALDGGSRGAVAVAMYGQTRADSLYVVAGAAVAAGAHRLQLAVGYEQKLEVPVGDYWYGRTDGGAVMRVGVVPVSLATMPDAPAGAAATEDPRALGWDPRRAALGLHLVVERDSWRLVAPTGKLASIATGDGDPRAALRESLAAVRAAFPDEDGLVLVIGTGATYAALISAATAAARDADGAPLFGRLALATAAPSPTKNTLARRVERRRAATVALTPDALASRAPVVRRCYQDLLERSPRLGGELRVELRDGRAEIVNGPRNAELRACALAGVAAPMTEQQIASANVTLSPR